MNPAPPGWYPDPASAPDSPALRWWDGTRWTEHAAPGAAPGAGQVPLTTPDGSAVASYGRRVGAYLLDSLFTSVLTIGPTVWITLAFLRSTNDLVDDLDPETGELPPGVFFGDYVDGLWWQLFAAIAISVVLVFVYHLVFLRIWSATPGKRILGLRVRRWEVDGPLDWPTAVKRAGMQYGVFALLGFVGANLLDLLWPLWDDRRQAVHDKVAGTVVVDAVSADVTPDERR